MKLEIFLQKNVFFCARTQTAQNFVDIVPTATTARLLNREINAAINVFAGIEIEHIFGVICSAEIVAVILLAYANLVARYLVQNLILHFLSYARPIELTLATTVYFVSIAITSLNRNCILILTHYFELHVILEILI